MYVNRYFDLYVKGKSEDEELTLKGICFEERSIFERSFFKLNFNSDSLKIDRRHNFTLVRKKEIISGLKWLEICPNTIKLKLTVNNEFFKNNFWNISYFLNFYKFFLPREIFRDMEGRINSRSGLKILF